MYRPLIGQCKCNATQGLSLISYMKELQAFKWLSIISWLVLPHLLLIFSFLNIRSKNEQWKFEKTLYIWFFVQIICIFGLSLSSFFKRLMHILQTGGFWMSKTRHFEYLLLIPKKY